MFCPQKELRLSDFARDLVDGIIWDNIKEEKVHPRVLCKMQVESNLGLFFNKELMRLRELEDLKKILSDTSETKKKRKNSQADDESL